MKHQSSLNSSTMMIVVLLSIISAVAGKEFISYRDDDLERSLRQCHDEGVIFCKMVHIDMEALMTSEELHLPIDTSMSRETSSTKSDYDGTVSMTFNNYREDLQAVFVYGETDGQVWTAGSINWAKAGRHFKLETCALEGNGRNCFVWKELDPSIWLNKDEPHHESTKSDGIEFSSEDDRLLAQGRVDNTTNAAVTVTVYITPQTK